MLGCLAVSFFSRSLRSLRLWARCDWVVVRFPVVQPPPFCSLPFVLFLIANQPFFIRCLQAHLEHGGWARILWHFTGVSGASKSPAHAAHKYTMLVLAPCTRTRTHMPLQLHAHTLGTRPHLHVVHVVRLLSCLAWLQTLNAFASYYETHFVPLPDSRTTLLRFPVHEPSSFGRSLTSRAHQSLQSSTVLLLLSHAVAVCAVVAMVIVMVIVMWFAACC